MHTISKDNKADCPTCETEEGTFMHIFLANTVKTFLEFGSFIHNIGLCIY